MTIDLLSAVVGGVVGAVAGLLGQLALPDRWRERFFQGLRGLKALVTNPTIRASLTWTYEVRGIPVEEDSPTSTETVRRGISSSLAEFHPAGPGGPTRSKAFDLETPRRRVGFEVAQLDSGDGSIPRVSISARCDLPWRSMEKFFLEIEDPARRVESKLATILHLQYLGFSVHLDFPASLAPFDLIDRRTATFISGGTADSSIRFQIGPNSLEASGGPSAALAGVLRPAVSHGS